MKISLRLVCLGFAVIVLSISTRVDAQGPSDPLFNPGAYQPVMAANLPSVIPGRTWLEANLAEDGLGYEGSYVTLGGKTHLFQDFLDGRWLVEAEGHISAESGGLFGNLGIERVFSIPAAGADVSGSVWADYDDDQQGDFAHTFTQVGVNAKIKTRRWDIYGNGYFPTGTTDHAQGDPTGAECFLNHSIVLQPGIDSALRGFDAMFRFRPEALGQYNGSVEFGGYSYDSELVEGFGGVRLRGGMQLMRGLLINTEVNHDDRFDFTGVLSFSMVYGGSARGTEYGLLGRDLEQTVRNDHIVRYQQDLVLAIDPDTGLPYNVYHVDNTADAAFADGRAETPFTMLVDAESAASTDDIIFVREGDGTTRGMDSGITLQDGQLLLGDGVQHLIPVQGGRLFELCNDIDGNLPTITNQGGGPAVTLASRNTVRGIIIDGNEAGAFISNGIQASSGSSQHNGIIEDVTITGAVLNGISLDGITGDWRFARNTITDSGFDGVFIDNATDSSSTFEFEENVVSQNGRDGVHIEDYNGTAFTFLQNEVSDNFRHGVRMERFAGTRADFDFLATTATDNIDDGISIVDADGNLRVLNSTITGNGANGVHLVDFRNTDSADSTLIGTTPGGSSVISGNGQGAGANVNIELNSGVQRATVTNTSLNNGGSGVFARSSGIGTFLDIDVIDNVAVSNNVADGMRFIADDGSSMDVTVANTGGALNLASNGGNGLSFLAGGTTGGALASLSATVRNVNIQGGGLTNNGVLGDVRDDAQLTLDIANSTIATTSVDGMDFTVATNPNLAVNFVRADNLTITSPTGNGIDIDVAADSFFDFVLTNSTLQNGGGDGIDITATGDTGAPIDDNRTRILVQDSSVTGFTFDGFSLNTFGDARALVNLDANAFNNNGLGTNAGALPYFHGVQMTANDDSVINTMLTNNQMTGNAERGLFMSTEESGSLNAILVGNSINSNDTGENGLGTSGIEDMRVTNAPLGTVCLAMSNNFFDLTATVENNGGAASFRLELDGATNGVGVPNIIGSVTQGPFSTVCIPQFDAETAAFEADGFPPQ